MEDFLSLVFNLIFQPIFTTNIFLKKYLMPHPDLSRVPQFYHNYISLVKEDNLMKAFKTNTNSFISFLESIPAEKHDYRYADEKWSIKEIIQHLVDAERVFSYRALRFGRKDPTHLPGFNENLFARHAKADKRNWNDLVEEFKAVRKSTELLFASFDNEQLDAEGISNDASVYVMGIGFICVGHCYHHQKIIQERYLS